MKQIFAYSAMLCSIAFFSCKKDSSSSSGTAAYSASAISTGMKVGYASKVKGSAPVSFKVAGAPVLDSLYDYLTYTAINSRYVVIRPHVYSGNAQGYYLTVNGADSFFKIDYTAAYNLRKAKTANKHSAAKGDVNDSAIVIKLPSSINSDTFSIRYAAYDDDSAVSNYITAIISIAGKDTSDNQKVAGTWRLNRTKYIDESDGETEDNTSWSDTIIYGLDTTSYMYSCNNGTLTQDNSGSISVPTYILGYIAQDYTFAANGQVSYLYNYTEKDLSWNNSCGSTYQYDDYSETDSFVGGFNYNASSKILTIVVDGNGKLGFDAENETVTNLFVQQFTVQSLSSTRAVISYQGDAGDYDGEFYLYELIKK